MIYLYITASVIGSLLLLAIGYFWGRHQSKQPSLKSKQSQIAFLNGFRYMLSNEPDRAIEAFLRAVQFDTDTVETYFALANLFRDKGEIERAIKIHQSIITRPQLDERLRLQALYDLAIDYKKGGFLDRAIQTFKEVIRRDPQKKEAYQELAEIYQTLKEWGKAAQVISQLAKITKEDYSLILAHFQTEEGKRLQEAGDIEAAERQYQKAIKQNAACLDAYLHLGDLYLEKGKYKKALKIWAKAIEASPDYSFLVFRRLERHLEKLQQEGIFKKIVKKLEESHKNPFALLFLAQYYLNQGNYQKAKAFLQQILEDNPHHIRAKQLLAQICLQEGNIEDAAQILKQISSPGANIYQCQECGYESSELSWKCPQCQKWETMKLKV